MIIHSDCPIVVPILLLKLSNKFSLEFKHKPKFEADIAESHDGTVLWAIPSNYVNDSGKTVSRILRSINLKSENLLVLHDELDLKIGELKLKEEAQKIENLVDTTGAGDLFAAGFLEHFIKNESLESCGSKGVELASRVIQQYGARLKT